MHQPHDPNPMLSTPSPRLFHFAAGDSGSWAIERVVGVTGETLPLAARLEMSSQLPAQAVMWTLAGATSNERYVTRPEKVALTGKQEGLGRHEATLSALIPIKKSDAWWALTQDERREVLEERSKHIEIGLRYLPAIARRLHHCRDLSFAQPFDFLTWFEFAPAASHAFDDLLAALRATPEWAYVEREVEIRLRSCES